MDEFELQLKSLPLAKPSSELKGRIFEQEPRRFRIFGLIDRRISVGWAASLALSAGLAGSFLTNTVIKPVVSETSTVEIRIIREEASEMNNMLDFTQPGAEQFMPDEMAISAETGEV